MSENVTILEQLIRLLLAMLVGMGIGLEREWREKAAGFRTITLVTLGACSFVLLGYYVPGYQIARLGAGVITGIGFLGAGTILRERGEVLGLTTAATVWIAAALGMAAGVGAYAVTAIGTLASLVVLLVFPALDLSSVVNDMRTYEITLPSDDTVEGRITNVFTSNGLRPHRQLMARDKDATTFVWRVYGRPSRHNKATEQLMSDEQVSSVAIS